MVGEYLSIASLHHGLQIIFSIKTTVWRHDLPFFPPFLARFLVILAPFWHRFRQKFTLVFPKNLLWYCPRLTKWRSCSIISTCMRGPLAQWLEQRTHNPLVTCSSHVGPTKIAVPNRRSAYTLQESHRRLESGSGWEGSWVVVLDTAFTDRIRGHCALTG